MTTRTKRTSILIVLLLLGILFIYLAVQRDRSIEPISDLTNKLPDAISTGLNELGFDTGGGSVRLIRYAYIDTDWVVASAELIDQPIDDPSRIMGYLFKYDGSSLKLVGFSADGFSKESVPKDTPKHIIEKANESW